LIFIKGNARSAMAVLVSVMAVASLNYAKPHRNRIVFWVAQGSFLCTTFKYLSVLLLASNDELNRIDNAQFNSEANSDFVGIFLIILDVTFVVASFFSLIAVVYLVHTILKKQKLGANVKIVPKDGSIVGEDDTESLKEEIRKLKWQQNIQSALNSAGHKNRSRLVSGRLKNQKSHRTLLVEKIQKDHKNHRQNAIDQIKKKQSTRRSSLIQKVAARKKAKHSKALLKSIYFSNLEEASISKIINAMDFVALDQNDDSEICRQGDVADTFYIIISGACQVTIDGRPITLLGALDIFGEIALFTGANDGRSIRSATVTKMVGKDLQLLTLSRKKFNALIASGTLNKECTAKLKRVAEERQKVHMPKEKKNTATIIQTQEKKQISAPDELDNPVERTLSNIARPVIKTEEHVKTHARRFSKTLGSEKFLTSVRLQQRIHRIKEVQASRVKEKRLGK